MDIEKRESTAADGETRFERASSSDKLTERDVTASEDLSRLSNEGAPEVKVKPQIKKKREKKVYRRY